MKPKFVALVPAAGRGLRFGGRDLKQWMVVAGRPVAVWTVERLLRFGASRVVVAVPPDGITDARSVLPDESVLVIAGGETRQQSVALCLDQVPAGADSLILVHDGVRPAVSETDLRATLAAASETGAAILGRSVHDTLKEVSDGRVVRTVDRGAFFRAETPQVFAREVLERAFSTAEGFTGTDEASLVERLGDIEIRAVEATGPNPKLTRPDQLVLLETLLS
jgi:2-C-methyl-D-erythritol 4-phosphate cytidylyltransferase